MVVFTIAGRASAAALPNVKIDVYSDSATTGDARLEFRIVKSIAIGAGYNYFTSTALLPIRSSAARYR
jgi:hypothetical protein